MEQKMRERGKTRAELTQFCNILGKNSTIEIAISEYVEVLIIKILNRFLQNSRKKYEKNYLKDKNKIK